jgi:hypothetical protein
MDGPTYDGVVLGAGHNALVLQAYLCRAGLRVLALERATAPGGGLATVENPAIPDSFTTRIHFSTAARQTCPGSATSSSASDTSSPN